MADNPFLQVLAQQSQGNDTQPPMSDVPASPDVSQLPATTASVPQPPAVPQQQQQAQPQQSNYPRPILYDLISSLARPRQISPGQVDANGVQGPPVYEGRAQAFERFIGNFLTAASAGFANAGHGPGSGMRGAGAAITAPYQMQQQQAAFQQQQQLGQAQIEQEAARTQQLQRQTELSGSMVTIQTPNGPMSLPYNVAIQSGLLKGALAAGITAQNKMSIAELNAATKQGAVKFIKPVQDPQTGKVVFGAYDAQGNFLRPLDNSIDPSALP